MWRLTNKGFSREWRRNKTYTLNEIRHLARRRGCTVKVRDHEATVLRGTNIVASFKESVDESVPVREEPRNERLQLFAALHV